MLTLTERVSGWRGPCLWVPETVTAPFGKQIRGEESARSPRDQASQPCTLTTDEQNGQRGSSSDLQTVLAPEQNEKIGDRSKYSSEIPATSSEAARIAHTALLCDTWLPSLVWLGNLASVSDCLLCGKARSSLRPLPWVMYSPTLPVRTFITRRREVPLCAWKLQLVLVGKCNGWARDIACVHSRNE